MEYPVTHSGITSSGGVGRDYVEAQGSVEDELALLWELQQADLDSYSHLPSEGGSSAGELSDGSQSGCEEGPNLSGFGSALPKPPKIAPVPTSRMEDSRAVLEEELAVQQRLSARMDQLWERKHALDARRDALHAKRAKRERCVRLQQTLGGDVDWDDACSSNPSIVVEKNFESNSNP